MKTHLFIEENQRKSDNDGAAILDALELVSKGEMDVVFLKRKPGDWKDPERTFARLEITRKMAVHKIKEIQA